MASIQETVKTRDTIPIEPLYKKVLFSTIAVALQGLLVAPAAVVRDAKAYFWPPETKPDLVKTYPCRRRLPVRYVQRQLS